MSDPAEKVHYQISVTGRQAAAFFLALLVALGLAFFFGMKTGAAAKKGPEAMAVLTQASDLPVAAATAAAEERRGSAPRPGEDVKLGFDPEKADKTDATQETPRPALSSPPPPTKPEPTATALPKPAAPATAQAKAPAKKETFWVQVLATQKPAVADELTNRLRADGFPADVTPVPGKPGWFRVRAGPYADRAKAESAAAKIQKVEKTKKRPIVVS